MVLKNDLRANSHLHSDHWTTWNNMKHIYNIHITFYEGTDSRNVVIQETEESRAIHFTFSFPYFLPLLPSIMDCTCRVAVVPNTKTTKTDTRWKKEAQVRNHAVLKEGKKSEIKRNSESWFQRGRRRIRWLQFQSQPAQQFVCSDPRFLEQPSKVVPKGLMGRQRSTTPFLTHHMLKEFSGALWVWHR